MLLPIPSTVVVAALGALLGFWLGTLVAVAGLTFGCVIGFVLGHVLGHDFAQRQLGADFDDLSALFRRHGLPILALCRPVPVLAEASIIAAGVLGLPAGRTLAVTGLANIGFAGVYASLGAVAESPSPGRFRRLARHSRLRSLGGQSRAALTAKNGRRSCRSGSKLNRR